MNYDGLDPVDRQLISLLKQNARTPTSALARELQVSRSTIQDRLARLERRKIIAGYTVRLDEGFAGRQIGAHVMIQVSPKQSTELAGALESLAAVKTLQTVSGLYDLIVTLETATTEEMDRVLDQIGALPGVTKTTTSIVLATKFQR